MNLKEFSRASGHVQEHFQTPLGVSDVAKDGFVLSTRGLDINAEKTINGMRYGIEASVRVNNCATIFEAVQALRKQFEELIAPQRRMTSESEPKPEHELAAALATLRSYRWDFATADDIDAFCGALLSSSKAISTTLATQRYMITIKPQTAQPTETEEENNGND